MASERPEGSGSMGDGWTPSPELLEERELLSGLLDGLSELAAGAPVEEAAAGLDPGAEEPPAVIAPPAEVSAIAAVSSPEAPAAAASSSSSGVPMASAISSAAQSASTSAPTAASNPGPGLTNGMPAAVEHATAPGAEAVDSLLAKAAVESGSHAGSAAVESGAVVEGPTARHAVDAKAAEAHAAAGGQAQVSTDVAAARATGPEAGLGTQAVNAAAVGSVSAHDAGMAESWVDGRASTDSELEFSPADEEAAQPHMMTEAPSGERTEEAAQQEMPTLEDNQSEAAEPPIERSLVQSAGAHAASRPSWVGAEAETMSAVQPGEVRIAEQATVKVGARAGEELVSRVAQLFDHVPNWPGVDLDALEDAARSLVEEGAQSGADFVDVVSTHDVASWMTATAGTAVGFGIARRELGLQTRDTVDGPPTDEDAELAWSPT